jgi:hypothetical protein
MSNNNETVRHLFARCDRMASAFFYIKYAIGCFVATTLMTACTIAAMAAIVGTVPSESESFIILAMSLLISMRQPKL